MSHSLNTPVIKQLILKDWFLNRKIILMYLVGALFALSIITRGEWQFFMGSTLFICVLVGLGNHQIAINIVGERKEQTLPFIMSLPITPLDYGVAKFVANMSVFFVPWAIIIACLMGIFSWHLLPGGLIPLSIILCVYFLLSYCVVWSVGMVTESEKIVLFIMIAFNCLISPIFYVLGRIDGISLYVKGNTAVWNSASIGVIAGEFLVILIALIAALFLQTRKTTFL